MAFAHGFPRGDAQNRAAAAAAKRLKDRVIGHGGGVVFAAQMGEDDLLCAGLGGLYRKFRGGIVGEVTAGAEDAVFEIVGIGAAEERSTS